MSGTSQANGDSAIEGDHIHCLICYSDLDYRGITPCDHNDICGVCHLRMRHLHGVKKCSICNTEIEKIIVDKEGKQFNEYPMWGDDVGNGFEYSEDVGMFFPTDYYKTEIEPLFGLHCTIKSCPYDGTTPDPNIYEQEEEQVCQTKKKKKPLTPLRALQDHLRTKHKLALCQLCVDHKRDFVANLPRFSASKLKTHLTKGDGPGSGFEGHPVCEFCRPKRFYDLALLHQHLRKDHYECHICKKQGLPNQFFKNYKSLEKHFDRQHFLCHDVQCLQARFVVFENEVELQVHERTVHGATSSGSTKIQLEFRTRRPGVDGSGVSEEQEVPTDSDFDFNLDGQAFVPQELPQSAGEVAVHPLHLARTEEFRAQAAVMRQQHSSQSNEEAFPTLSAANDQTNTPNLTFGWTSGSGVQRVIANTANASVVTAESFPALPTGKKKKVPKAKSSHVPLPSRQFAAIRNAATQPTSTANVPIWSGSSAVAASRAPQSILETRAPPAKPMNRQVDLSADNFPTLAGASPQPARYTKAMAYTQNRMNQQQPPSWNSINDFPPPAAQAKSAPSIPTAYKKAPTPTPPPKKAPSVNSVSDFPLPPTSRASANSVKQKVLGNQRKGPSQAAMDNMLRVPQSQVNAETALSDMQASLGKNKYKKLKNFTKDFAAGFLEAEAYVDHSASLFDGGYGDPDFWKYFPALVSSCPNQAASDLALRYMQSLRHVRVVSPPVAKAPQQANGWNNNNASSVIASPFPTHATQKPPAVAAPPSRGPRPNYIVPGKKKAAWGAGGSAPVIRASKAPVGSNIAAAAATQGPQGGTATKFMAKHTKQMQQQDQQPQSTKKGKKKKSNELKNLAFGR